MARQELEERTILSLLEGTGPAIGVEAVGGDEGQRLMREYVEVLGLLPRALDPVEPRPEVKERLMAAVAAEGEARTGPAAGGGEALPFRRPAGAEDRPGTTAGRSWSLAWAAGLALLMLGSSVFLYLRLQGAQEQIARLSAELAQVSRQEQVASARLAGMEREVAAVSQRFAMVTESGAEACPLRPVGGEPLHPLARGVLFIAADHQHWFLKVTGLGQAPEERIYQLWFITESGPVSAGTFRPGPGAEAEIGSPSMPSGITAVAVTLEPAGGAPEPGGTTVLYGAEKMSLL